MDRLNRLIDRVEELRNELERERERALSALQELGEPAHAANEAAFEAARDGLCGMLEAVEHLLHEEVDLAACREHVRWADQRLLAAEALADELRGDLPLTA